MPQYVIDKKDFLKGLSLSEELGGFWRDMQGIDVYRTPGVLRPAVILGSVYSESSSPALTTPITQLIPTNVDGSIQAVIALSNAHAVRIRLNAADSENVATTVVFSGANAADKLGAAIYRLGSASSNRPALFYSLDTDIGMYDFSLAFGTNGNWDDNFMSTIPASGAAIGSERFRAMYHHKRHNILYWNDGNEVDKFDALTGVNGTLTQSALDLPVEWEIRDFAQLRDYLAILAVNPPTGGSDDQFIQVNSKVFFWDGISDSWNYETPLIHDHIVRLLNTEGGLFGVGKGDGISYYQFELEQSRRIFNWLGTGSAIDITAGRRDGNDLASYGGITAAGNQILLLGKDGNNAHVLSLSNRFNLKQIVLNKLYYLKTAAGTIDLGDIVAVSPTKIYASIHDDNGAGADQYRVVRFSSGNSSETVARGDTVELSNYFERTPGRKKRINYIEFYTDELASADVLEIYKEIDYDATWTRLDGAGSAGAENSIRESDFSGENRTTLKFTRTDPFRFLRLRFDFTAGNIKVRRIVVDFDYV